MQKMNDVSSTEIRKKPQPKINGSAPVSNPINTISSAADVQVQLSALPCDKSAAVSPILPSDLLNEKDIKRYYKVREEFAKDLARKIKIPVENVRARLPEIIPLSLEETKEWLSKGMIAAFDPKDNIIKLSPIKEIMCLYGGDESMVVHELTHGFSHNSSRAFVKQIPQNELGLETSDIVASKMLYGEHGAIIKELCLKNVNGQQTCVPKFMNVPPLSAAERRSLLDTLNSIENEHLDLDTVKLNDAGKELVRKTLLPRLEDYKKLFSGNPEAAEEKAFKNVVDYIDSFFTRRNLIIACLSSPALPDLEKNLKTPLSKTTEKNLTKNYIKGVLSNQEGSRLALEKSLDDSSLKSYFMSYDEQLARRFENKYRLKKINQKIAKYNKQGFKPPNALLKEQQIVKNNLKLLNLTKKFGVVEQQIISAPKDSEKLKEIIKMEEELERTSHGSKFDKKIIKFVKDDLKTFLASVETEDEFIEILKQKLPFELKEHVNSFVELSKKNGELAARIESLNTPYNLLANTVENNALKTQFDNILGKIRKISKECDVSGIPKAFFKSAEDFAKAHEKASRVILKWSKRLAKIKI